MRQFLSQMVFHTERPAYQNHMFRNQIRARAIRRLQGLLFAVCVLALMLWPEDVLLAKPPEIVWMFGAWRVFIAGLAGVSLLALQFFEWFRKNMISFFVLFVCSAMVFSGILFGSHRGLDYPWFNFLAFLIPMFSIVLCVEIGTRFLAALAMVASFVLPYVYCAWPGRVNEYYLTLYVPLLGSTTVLSVVIGHVIYHYDYVSYFRRRKVDVQKQKIAEVAKTDQLTGLLERHEIIDQYENLFEEARREGFDLSLVMFDIDHFKRVNDTYGHTIGDRVLQRLGEIIQEETRTMDYAGRYGGEEFCVIMPKTDLEGAQKTTQRLRESIKNETFQAGGDTFSVTCSFGIATLEEIIVRAEDFLKAADDALYEAKNKGRDCIVVG